MATLLPNAKQQFFNGNGQPLAGGSVYMYIPNTTVFKNTWKDGGQTTLNTNPIILDANGEALIYGAGAYRQVVYDVNGVLQWDAQTQDLTSVLQGQTNIWCGLAGGTGNNISLLPNPAVTALVAGQNFEFIASAANIAVSVAVNVSGLGAQPALFRGAQPPAGLLASGVSTQIVWNGSAFDIIAPAPAIFNNNITNSPNITIAPTGNTITTLTSFNVQSNAASANTREFLVSLGFTSAVGSAFAGPPNYADKAALYAGMVGNTGTSNIWAFNTVTTVQTAGAGLYNADGYECDINNVSGNDYADPQTGPAVACYGVITSMGGSNKTSSGFTSTCFSGGCWYGFMCAGTNFLNSAYLDLSSGSVNSFKAYGSKSGATIDISQASSSASIGLLLNQGNSIYSQNAGKTANYNLIGASGASVIVGDSTHWTNVLLNASTAVYTAVDNTATLGTSLARWSVVYAATGTINTSDENVKFDIAPLPNGMLELVKNTDPISYKHKDGGAEPVEIEQEEDVPVIQEIQTTKKSVKFENGRAVQVEEPDVILNNIYDEFPVFDENGAQVFDITPAKPEARDTNGNIVVEAQAEIRAPRIHRIQRMERKLVKKTVMQRRAGRRTHFGFSAQKIYEVTSKLSDFQGNPLDFAGFTQDPTTGLCGLRMDQLIPILWKAIQELSAEVETLKQGK